ncbi:MAG: hypothetical protein V7641_750 [Blastocatellia bacterium]
MESITRDNLLARLVEAVPEFIADPEYVEDDLAYLVFNDLTRFILSLLETETDKKLIQRVFDFIEEVARVQDQTITDVLSDSFNELAIKEPKRARSYMGKFTSKIFQNVEDEVYGDTSIARKIGRAIKHL